MTVLGDVGGNSKGGISDVETNDQLGVKIGSLSTLTVRSRNASLVASIDGVDRIGVGAQSDELA